MFKNHWFDCPDAHGHHRLHYLRWGAADNPRVLVCVHGLTRNARDFDALASALKQDYQILCPDIVGRGASDWLDDPKDYGYVQYVQDMLAWLQHLKLETVDWLGTSMGGIIGMLIAAQANSPIRRLILNDVGAMIPKTALERIASYLTQPAPNFATLAIAEQYIRKVHAPFGPLSDAQWRHLSEHSLRPALSGGLQLAYDPSIALAFQGTQVDVSLQPVWDALRCPILVLHGAESDLLLPETLAQMQASQPQAQVVSFPGIGHAPALMAAEQIRVVHDWLLSDKRRD